MNTPSERDRLLEAARQRRTGHQADQVARELETPGLGVRIVEATIGSPWLDSARKEVAKRYTTFAREGLGEDEVYRKLFLTDPYMDPERSRTLVALEKGTDRFLGTIQLTFGQEEDKARVDSRGVSLKPIEAMSLMHPPAGKDVVAEWPNRAGDQLCSDSQIGELGRLAIIPGVTRKERAEILKELTYEAIKIAKVEKDIKQVYAIMPPFVYSLFEEAEIIPQHLIGATLREEEEAVGVYDDFPNYWKRKLRQPQLYRFFV